MGFCDLAITPDGTKALVSTNDANDRAVGITVIELSTRTVVGSVSLSSTSLRGLSTLQGIAITAPKNLDKSEHSPLKEWCRPRLDTTAKQFCCRFAC